MKWVITDKETWESTKPGSENVYVWKVGSSPLLRLYDSPGEAAQGLLDYITGAWKQVGQGISIGPEDFVVLTYTGTKTEAELDQGVGIGRVPKSDLSHYQAAHQVVLDLHIKASTPLNTATESGFAAVKKEDYNGVKMNGGDGDVVMWCTGKSENRRRIYDTVDEAREGLAHYITEDWDGIVKEQELVHTDFVIVEVMNPQGIYQIYTKSSNVKLAAIVSVPKSFTEDDALF